MPPFLYELERWFHGSSNNCCRPQREWYRGQVDGVPWGALQTESPWAPTRCELMPIYVCPCSRFTSPIATSKVCSMRIVRRPRGRPRLGHRNLFGGTVMCTAIRPWPTTPIHQRRLRKSRRYFRASMGSRRAGGCSEYPHACRIGDPEPLRGSDGGGGPAGHLHADVLYPRPQTSRVRTQLSKV